MLLCLLLRVTLPVVWSYLDKLRPCLWCFWSGICKSAHTNINQYLRILTKLKWNQPMKQSAIAKHINKQTSHFRGPHRSHRALSQWTACEPFSCYFILLIVLMKCEIFHCLPGGRLPPELSAVFLFHLWQKATAAVKANNCGRRRSLCGRRDAAKWKDFSGLLFHLVSSIWPVCTRRRPSAVTFRVEVIDWLQTHGAPGLHTCAEERTTCLCGPILKHNGCLLLWETRMWNSQNVHL